MPANLKIFVCCLLLSITSCKTRNAENAEVLSFSKVTKECGPTGANKIDPSIPADFIKDRSHIANAEFLKQFGPHLRVNEQGNIRLECKLGNFFVLAAWDGYDDNKQLSLLFVGHEKISQKQQEDLDELREQIDRQFNLAQINCKGSLLKVLDATKYRWSIPRNSPRILSADKTIMGMIANKLTKSTTEQDQ